MDLMFLPDRKKKTRPVLHIIDAGTRFRAAAFLTKYDSQTLWNTFVKIRSSVYVGFPESVLLDQGSVILSNEWSSNFELSGIKLFHSGTESHKSLGIGEKYHSTLRTIYRRFGSTIQTFLVM